MVLYMNYATTSNERNTTMMSEDKNSEAQVKIGLLILKAIPSVVIEVGLSEQERLASEEQRLNDLKFIRSVKNIKHDIDSALDEWIVNL
jgi:hypothetical protein